MLQVIKDIGALAGIGAFLGVAVLSLLYFSQARDVRRLRDWAGRAPERDAEDVEVTSDLAAERAEELRKVEEERARREAALTAERQADSKRDERRRRRDAGLPEQTGLERIREQFGGGAGRRLPEPRYLAVGIGAVIVLGVAITVGVLALSGGGGGSGKASKGGSVKSSQFEVAVLNGTNPPVNGLAGTVSNKLESQGFHAGRVGNSRDSYAVSMVAFKNGYRPEASKVARTLHIQKLRMMSGGIRGDAAGAPVAVVVGQDKSSFSG